MKKSGRSLSNQSLTYKFKGLHDDIKFPKSSRSNDSSRDLIKKTTVTPDYKIKSKVLNLTKSSLDLTFKNISNKPFKSSFKNVPLSTAGTQKDIINLIRSQHSQYMSQRAENKITRDSRERRNLDQPQRHDLAQSQRDIIMPKLSANRPRTRNIINDAPQANKILPNFVLQVCSKTRTGCISGKKKLNNQDQCLIENHFAQTENVSLYSVMDGHGTNGHDVSAFVKRVLPSYIENFLPLDWHNKTDEILAQKDINKLKSAISKAHASTNMELFNSKTIDTSYSGTTSVSVLLRGKLVLCANVGDSRAVLGRFDLGK